MCARDRLQTLKKRVHRVEENGDQCSRQDVSGDLPAVRDVRGAVLYGGDDEEERTAAPVGEFHATRPVQADRFRNHKPLVFCGQRYVYSAKIFLQRFQAIRGKRNYNTTNPTRLIFSAWTCHERRLDNVRYFLLSSCAYAL